MPSSHTTRAPRTLAVALTTAGSVLSLAAAPTAPAQSTPAQPAASAQFAPHAMIASNSPLASAAGVEILRRGGNAVDAAVATGFALAVTLPEAGNLGGGGFMLLRLGDGRTAAIDYRETAPAAASHDMYLGPDGKPTDASVVGYRASGVPGSVAGMLEAERRYGRLPLAAVMAPAIRLAEQGFTVDSLFYRSVAGSRELLARFDGASLFLPGGQPPAVGSTFRQPALARTLRMIAQRGAAGFYRGPVAAAVAAEMQRHGGTITARDLAAYRPVWRTPLRSTYRGYHVLGMPPSSSGGVTSIETLNILATYPALPPFGSAAYAQLVASAFQRAFIDRNDRLGDPAFVRNPLDTLTSRAYAAAWRRTMTGQHVPTAELMAHTPTLAASEPTETTHYSAVDGEGGAVATTTTLNNLYGSGVFVPEAGFFLNDEMDDFTVHPGSPNMFGLVMGEANAIAPGKRMLSSMTPTIITDSANRLFLVLGARGGPRIITSVVQVILNVIDNHMTLAEAMRVGRIHDQALPDSLMFERERGALYPAVQDSLRAMGWALKPSGAGAQVDAVMRVRGGYEGMDDPRHGARAVGY